MFWWAIIGEMALFSEIQKSALLIKLLDSSIHFKNFISLTGSTKNKLTYMSVSFVRFGFII